MSSSKIIIQAQPSLEFGTPQLLNLSTSVVASSTLTLVVPLIKRILQARAAVFVPVQGPFWPQSLAMAGFVEFYIACNPPLLPNGVASIIYYALKNFEPVRTQ